MINRHEMIDLFSREEYLRRINGLRSIMGQEDLHVLIFTECSEEAYDQWLTGKRLLRYIIVPKQDEVIGVMWSEFDESGCSCGAEPDFSRYTIQKKPDPLCDGVRFVNCLSDEKLVSMFATERSVRVGVVQPGRMTHSLSCALHKQLPHGELVDVTRPVSIFRSIKSEEELAAIRNTRDVQVRIFEALPQMLRVGRRMRDVNNELRHMLMSYGATGTLSALVTNNGQGVIALSENYGENDRVLAHGDTLFALMEANSAGQQHMAFGRHLVLGEPPEGMLSTVQNSVKVHRFAASMFRPGETLANIAVATRKYANTLGYHLREELGWNWMHSLGAFIYEQYAIEDIGETWPLQEGQVLHCHPMLYSYYNEGTRIIRKEVMVLNTYRVGKNGPEDLVNVPFDPVVIE